MGDTPTPTGEPGVWAGYLRLREETERLRAEVARLTQERDEARAYADDCGRNHHAMSMELAECQAELATIRQQQTPQPPTGEWTPATAASYLRSVTAPELELDGRKGSVRAVLEIADLLAAMTPPPPHRDGPEGWDVGAGVVTIRAGMDGGAVGRPRVGKPRPRRLGQRP